MTIKFTQFVGAVLLGVTMLSSCSRPIAYFQHDTVNHYITPKTQPLATTVQAVTEPIEPRTQANAAMTQIEAYVRNDNKLATDKKLNQRMVRVKKLLASTQVTLESKVALAPHKMNVAERLMLKKMNKKIGQHLAPNSPEKALVHRAKLIGSVVLLIAGLVLLIAGTGTVAFIGLIVALVGGLGTLVSLFGIDS